MSKVQYLLLLGVALVLGGCAGQSTLPATAPHPGPAVAGEILAAGLPVWPPVRSAAVLSTTDIQALDTYDRSANTVELDTTLLLNSSTGTTSWALYEFNYGLEFLSQVEVLLTVSGLSQVYVAVADYAAGSWDVRGPFDSSQVLSLDQAAHRNAAGSYYLAVLTTGGDSATLLKLIATIDSGWTIVTVDGSLTAGVEVHGLGFSLVDGYPAVAYYDTATDDLNYAQSSDPLGLTAESWTITPVDTDGDVGRSPGLALVEGQPAVSYFDNSQLNLKYARRTEPGGAWETATVDDNENVGSATSLAVVSGNPAIAYFDGVSGALKYCRATTATGFGPGNFWTIANAIDNGEATGYYLSMIEIEGRPAIACHQFGFTSGKLYYTICDNELGLVPSQWELVVVDGVGLTGVTPNVFSYDGRVHISYLDITAGTLQVAASTTATGANAADWPAPLVIDDSGYTGRYSSFAVIDGRPAFSYYDDDNRDLLFSWAESAALNGNWQKMTVDSEGRTGKWSRLQVVGGHPAIAFVRETAGEICYAIYRTP